jgi:hypothetical protein
VNYDRNKFYDSGPRSIFDENLIIEKVPKIFKDIKFLKNITVRKIAAFYGRKITISIEIFRAHVFTRRGLVQTLKQRQDT